MSFEWYCEILQSIHPNLAPEVIADMAKEDIALFEEDMRKGDPWQ